MSEEAAKYVPFGERPEWNDVQPLPQDDGPSGGVCPIAYTDQFRDTMDYFRAIVHKDERSARALGLTAEVIKLNAANYTAWYYRRLVLEALDSDVTKELGWTAAIAADNPKNYQIWYHRRALVERTRDPSLELDFTAQMIDEDSKNYHAWAHRQWVLQTFGLWDGELVYIDQKLQEDRRNNSAWNQRYFVIANTKDSSSIPVREEEIKYALSYVQKAPNNPSPWHYLKGQFRGIRFGDIAWVKDTCVEYKERYPTTPHAPSLLVDIYEEEDTVESLTAALQECQLLAEKLVPHHKKYWNYRTQQIQSKLSSKQQ
ncbi:Protein farnesyltransferase/geranylgeranyltransferase type-1 subunit alpha [Balamuthia mandrillaris]